MKAYLILVLTAISLNIYAQEPDTVIVYDHYCESSNPHEIDTTYFWYDTDTLFIRNVHNSFCGPKELKASITTKDDSIKIIVFNPSETDCLADCSFGYTIKLETGVFDSLIIQIFDEVFTIKYADLETGIDDLIINQVNAFPNPVNDLLTISIEKIEEVKIIDLAGKTVLFQKGSLNQIDVSTLQNGIYVLKVKADSKMLTGKIMKQ